MTLIATLKLPDGRVFVIEEEITNREGAIYNWTDGNFSCDCNRSLTINRQHNLELISPSEEDCLTCGDTIELVSLKIDGQLV
jgi:hypothetical protein